VRPVTWYTHLLAVSEMVDVDWSTDEQRDELSDHGSVVCLETRRATSKDLRLT